MTKRKYVDGQMNPQVHTLLQVLVGRDIPPTPEEIRKVVEIAYAVGKNDGALAATQKALDAHTKVTG